MELSTLVMARTAVAVLAAYAATTYVAWFRRDVCPVSWNVLTQRDRISWFLLGQAACVTVMAWPLAVHGVDAPCFGDGTLWDRGLLALPAVLLCWLGLAGPITTAAVLARIHRTPSQAAFKIAGGYVLTRHVRRRLDPLPVVVPDPPTAPGAPPSWRGR